MPLNTALRGVVNEDLVTKHDIQSGSKPSLNLTFRNITDRLSGKPVVGTLAPEHRLGDYWTDDIEYVFVSNPVEQKWAMPADSQFSGGGGSGLTPQERATIYARDPYAENVVYHSSSSATRPNVTNVVARPDNLSTFDVDGGWTHAIGDDTAYQVTIYIQAGEAGDSRASGWAGAVKPYNRSGGGATAVKPYAAQGGRGIQGDDIQDNTIPEDKLDSATQTKLNAEGTQVKPYAAQGGRAIEGDDIGVGEVQEDKLSQGVQTKLNAEGTQVKPYAAQGGREIQGGDIQDETIPEGKLDAATQTKLNATGGANDSITSVGIRGDGSETFLTSRTRGGSDNAVGFRTVPSGGTTGQALIKGANNLFDWADLPSQESNTAAWAQTGNTDTVPPAKIDNTIARRAEVEGEIALLEAAIQANVLPRQLDLFGRDVRVEKHPEGVWGQRDDSTVGINIGGAFLVSNDKTTTKGIPQEVGAVKDYSAADLPPAPNPNFVREHADPNEDSNPFLGVTPYCNGPVILTTPANQRRKVFTGIWGQQTPSRPTDTNLTAENTMFSVGTKGLIRWNRAGIEVRTGADSAINRQVTQYLRIGSQNLSNLGNAAYTPPALASSYTGSSQTFRLVANEFDADESVARQSPSVDVEANASTKNFTITLANRTPLTGNITYNGSTRVATINITGGSQLPGSHIELDVRVRNTFTYTRPSRTVYEALVLEDDVVRAGVRDIFSQNHKNVFVFAFEKQYDEDDSNDNIMKLVFRINGITREINLHQTYGELGLGGTDFRIGASLQYVSHIQASTATEDLGTEDLLALDVEQIGWGQLQQNHREDNVNLAAIFAATGFAIRNEDGTISPFNPSEPWAQMGNAQKIPSSKLNLGATNPSGIINPVVIDIQHFDGTTDVDTGRPVDGANSWRSQFQLIRIIPSYGKGNSLSAAENAALTHKVVDIPIDALPANRPAGWIRDLDFDDYEGTFERVGVRVFQPASSNGQANLHFHLYYKNHSNGQVFRATSPGAIGRFANLRIAQFHDFGGQAYVMPRSAKGEQGDQGPAGLKGDTGLNGSDAQVKPFAQLGSSTLIATVDISDGAITEAKLAPAVITKLNKAPGLDQNAVDARVKAGVQNWAETDNNDPIPAEKLTNAPSGGSSSRVFSGAYNSALDFNTLSAAGNTLPEGMWSDGTTMWVLNDNSTIVRAYNLATKARDSSKDFNLTSENTRPQDIWSDGTTIWVSDFSDSKIYAYVMATKAYDSSKDFNTLAAADNTQPQGIWSDGTTMWVGDSRHDKLFAYNLATKARDAAKDFNTLAAAGNTAPQGMWSDGITMWVGDSEAHKLFAYNLESKAYDSERDFNTLMEAGNTSIKGVWSDGTTMWVSDDSDDKLFAYDIYGNLALNQSAVDERVKSGVKDFAESDSSTKIASGDTDFATRLLPSNPDANQIAQWNGTSWVAINTPTGGGGGGSAVSGVSGWGNNLISTPITGVANGANVPASRRTIDLSGEVDEIKVIASSTDGLHRNSVEIVTPMTATESHQIILETTTSGAAFNFTSVDFSFPTATGANAVIQLDRTGATNARIVGVYKRTRGSVTPSGGRPAIVVNDNYLRLGAFDLDSSTARGVVGSNGQVMTQVTAGVPVNQDITFLNSVAGDNNIPTGATYNQANGQIVLPAGHWSVCVSANIHSGAALDSNIRIYTLLSLLQGTGNTANSLTGSTLYLRNREGSILQDIQGKVAIACTVISDGTTPITAHVTMEYDRTGTGNITVAAASISAYRMLI